LPRKGGDSTAGRASSGEVRRRLTNIQAIDLGNDFQATVDFSI